MSFSSVDELKTFKKMTGGDSLFAEFKGQQAFEFTFNGLLWFCMNRLPKFGGDDGKWVENNHGYARTAKEFSEQLAGYLGGTFTDVTTRQKGNTYYKDFTITEETKELYVKEYGYEETEFLAG